jgi:autotransporter-associated beta strand protein
MRRILVTVPGDAMPSDCLSRPRTRSACLVPLLALVALASPCGGLSTARAEQIAFFDLNGITNAQISSLQYQTGNQLVFGATLTDWTKSGFNAVHAIQLSGSTPGGPGNYAPMIFSDNFITMDSGFAANTKGTLYYVSYDIGPTVYANPAQATTTSDALRVNLLRGDGSILATNDVAPGAWAGVQSFTQAYFAYVGDGTGPIRIQMRSADPGSGRFSGAVDNMGFWTSNPVAPTYAYWAPASGAGGDGTWNTANAFWAPAGDGSGTKQAWNNSVQTNAAFFGGVAGSVTLSGTLVTNRMNFATTGYTISGGAGSGIAYNGSGPTITLVGGVAATIAANQTGSQGIVIDGAGGTSRLTFAGNNTYTGDTIVSDATLAVTGTIANSSVSVLAGAALGGTGRINGTVGGAGLVSPGNSPGILTVGAIDPTDGLDFTFEFSGTAPNYASGTASVNDVLRLTGSTPFLASLTNANTKTLFLNLTEAQLGLGTVLQGAFFTDADGDFLALLNNKPWDNAGFTVYVLGDGNGTDNRLNGQGYYNWRNPDMFGWTQSLFASTEVVTANFAGGSETGRVLTLVVGVPEPSTYALGLAGAGFIGLARWSRRRSRRT